METNLDDEKYLKWHTNKLLGGSFGWCFTSGTLGSKFSNKKYCSNRKHIKFPGEVYVWF